MENFKRIKISIKKILSKNHIILAILSFLIINLLFSFTNFNKTFAQNNLDKNYGSSFKENETY